MTRHACHPLIPGYSPGQVLVDDCMGCDNQSGRLFFALQFLDDTAFRAAMARAEAKAGGCLEDCSDTEADLLDDLAAVMSRLRQLGMVREPAEATA
jgi:hypothetical protein